MTSNFFSPPARWMDVPAYPYGQRSRMRLATDHYRTGFEHFSLTLYAYTTTLALVASNEPQNGRKRQADADVPFLWRHSGMIPRTRQQFPSGDVRSR